MPRKQCEYFKTVAGARELNNQVRRAVKFGFTFRWYTVGAYAFVYSTSPNHANDFFALKLWYNQSKKTLKVQATRKFKRRWKAKDMCWKWYCEKKGREFQSLHHVSNAARERGKKLYASQTAKRQKKARADMLAQIAGKKA